MMNDRRQFSRRNTHDRRSLSAKAESPIKRTTRLQQHEPPYSVVEAGRLLGIGRGLAYELVRRGEIPSLQLGRRRVVPRAVVDALLQAPELE